MGPMLAALIALGVGAASVVLDPAQSLTPAALSNGLRGSLAAGLGLCLCWLAGAGLLGSLAPRTLTGALGWLQALVAGLLVWGLLLLGLAAVLGVGPMSLAASGGGLLVLGVAGIVRGGTPPMPVPSPGLGLWVLVLVVPGLVVALAPPLDTDELYYHLALPQKMLQHGELVGGLLNPSGSRPLLLHLPFTALLWIGGDAAPRLFHLGLASALLAGTAGLASERGGRWAGVAAAALLVGSYSFVHEGGLAANNLPTALAVLALCDAAHRGEARGMAVAAAAALSVKYTAAAAVVGLFCTARVPWRDRVLAGAAALALVAPWWVRNLLGDLHPLFPFAGWPTDLPFQYLDKYGAGRTWLDLLLLPWNVVVTAEVTSNRFLGRVSPLWLVAGLCAAVRILRREDQHLRLLGACGVVWLGWAAGPHWLRYLLPGAPLLAVAASVGLSGVLEGTARRVTQTLFVAGIAAVWLVGLPSNLGPVVQDAADRLDAARGAESRSDFYAARYHPWTAVQWANQNLPKDARVALFFDWSGYLLERPVWLGSVEDHVPARHWVLTHGDGSLAALRDEGVTHVMVRRTRFLRKIYPFLDEDHLASVFDDPVDALDEQLLLQATLIFQSGTNRIYRLPPPDHR